MDVAERLLDADADLVQEICDNSGAGLMVTGSAHVYHKWEAIQILCFQLLYRFADLL